MMPSPSCRADAVHEVTGPLRVDGLTGATVTSNAVTNLMQFWLGPHGYGPFLERFREGEADI